MKNLQILTTLLAMFGSEPKGDHRDKPATPSHIVAERKAQAQARRERRNAKRLRDTARIKTHYGKTPCERDGDQ